MLRTKIAPSLPSVFFNIALERNSAIADNESGESI